MNVLKLMRTKRTNYRFIVDTLFRKDKDLQMNSGMFKVCPSRFLMLLLISVHHHFCPPEWHFIIV